MHKSNSELESKIASLAQELDDALEQQVATADVLKAISRSDFDLDTVLRTLVGSAIRLCDATRGVIWLRRGEQLFLAAHVNYPQEWVDAVRDTPLTPAADAQTTSGLAAFTGEIVHVEDVPNDPRFRSLAAHKLGDYRGGLAVPLKRGGEVLGTISLSRPEARLFTERQVALVQTFADQAVIAIENVRLFEEVQARNRDVTEALEQQTATADVLKTISSSAFDLDAVLHTLVKSASDLCHAPMGCIYLRDGDDFRVAMQVGWTDEFYEFMSRHPMRAGTGSVTSRTALTAAIVHIPDAAADPAYTFTQGQKIGGFRTVLGVPLLRDGRVMGVFVLARPTVRPFGQREIELVQTFSDQAIIALENVRLFEEVQARNREVTEALERQTATGAILRVIAESPTNIQPVLDAVAESAARLCDAYDATIYLLRADWLAVGAHHGPIPIDDAGLPVARDVVTGRAVLERSPVHVHDLTLAGDEFATGRMMAHRLGFRTILATPLLQEGEAIGALMIRRTEARPFGEGQIDLLKTFANQAVIAISNVRLFEEVQARNREVTETLEQQNATNEVLRIIAASPTDIQPVFTVVVESAARLCDAYDAVIRLRQGDTLVLGAHFGPIAVDSAAWPLTRDRVVGRSVIDRATVHIADLAAADSDFAAARAMAAKFGFHTILAVPLLRDGEAIGAITLRRNEVRLFGEKQIELLKTFADQAVIAIENVRLFEEVQARTAELGEALKQQTATADVLKVISRSAFDLQSVLQTLIDSACMLCGSHTGGVYMLEGDVYRLAANYGMRPALIAHEARLALRVGRDSYVGRTALERTVIHVPDVGQDLEYGFPDLPNLGGFKAVLSVPLMREGSPIGVFSMGKAAPGPFTPHQVELVQTFADQAVIAIENVRLFDEVQARTTELGEALQQQTATADVLKVISRSAFDLQSVLQTLIDSAGILCGAKSSGIYMLHGDVYRLAAEHGMTDELRAFELTHPNSVGRDSYVGRTALEKAVIHIPDVRGDPEYGFPDLPRMGGFAAILSVPLMREGMPIGVFSMSRPEPGPFTARQIELVQTFADQAVIAIENVRLFEEVQARTAELTESLQQQTATADVLKAISRSAFDLQPVLQTLVDSAVRLCGADKGAITLREGDTLRFMAGAGASAELYAYERSHPHPLGRGTFQGRAALEGATVHVPDVFQDAEYERREAAIIGDFRAALSVPLRRGREIIGVFGLARRTTGPFTQRQIELVESFADQAVIAIENVRLFDEVQARTAELGEALQQQTATADVLKAISRSTFDLQPILDTLVESAARLCDADKGVIFKRDGDNYRWSANFGNPPELEAFAKANPFTPGRYSVTSRVALESRAIHVSDVLADPEYGATQFQKLGGYRTILCVPILREGAPVGVFALTRSEVRDFTPRQIELVETFADQAGIAIENVRLFDEVQARTADLSEALKQQTATADVLKAISRSTFDLPAVLDALVASAATLCSATYGGIFLRDGDVLRGRATISERKTDWGLDHPIEIDQRWISGRVALSGRIEHIPDVLEDKEYYLEGLRQITDTRALMGVPLLREGKVEGVFFLGRPDPGAFTTRQSELVQTFADQAVIAIENSRLFGQVQARTKELSRSIEELQTAQGRLIQTEKLASLGQLTAGIAHEIKNPLNFVNNFSSLSVELIDDLREVLEAVTLDGKTRADVDELADMLKGNLEKVVQHGKRADSIVKNMLLHSREGSGEHRFVDINAVVEESLNLAYHGARAEKPGFNITLTKTLDPDAGDVDLYPQEITRVLLNLISNGFYATVKRGVDANGAAYEPALAASTKNLGDSVEIRIRDNGTGIPPDVKEKMFNPFFTTKPAGEGTGLGLSLSHDIIVKQHAGTIEVDTEPGSFTEFRIVLPRRAATLGISGGPA